MTSTHDLTAVADALGTAFASAGLGLEPAAGVADIVGTLTAVAFTTGGDVVPATIAVATDAGLDLFDAAVAALQKAMPGMTPGEPTAVNSVVELDPSRPGDIAHHTILSDGRPIGVLMLEEDRRRASSPAAPPFDSAAPASEPADVTAGTPLSGVPGPSAPAPPPATGFGAGGLSVLSEVMLDVTVDLGRQSLPLSEVLALSVGSVVELDRAAGAPVDIRVNGILFGRGEVVVVDDEYAVRIIEILETPGS